MVTINSDDPPMFGTTLNREYEIAADLLGLDESGVADLARAGVGASCRVAGPLDRLRTALIRASSSRGLNGLVRVKWAGLPQWVVFGRAVDPSVGTQVGLVPSTSWLLNWKINYTVLCFIQEVKFTSP